MKKPVIIAICIILAVVIIPTVVWGISRLQLKKENAKRISGTWVETNWSADDKFNPDDETLYHTIDFDSSKEFRLLCLTDIHYRNGGWYGTWTINYQNTKTDRDIREMTEEVKPDLILATGDLETGTLNDKNYEAFVKVMDSLGVPWTIVFGNHDAEHRADKPAIMNILQKSENGIFRQGPTNLGITKDRVIDESVYDENTDKYAGGLGNTVINLRDRDTGIIYYAFILTDTGDWQNMYGNMQAKNRLDVGHRPFSRVGVGLTDRQIEWYKWVIDGLTEYNESKGGKMPETMFVSHIGMKIYEYALILSQYDNEFGGKYSETGFDNNDLPFSADTEWCSPSDRPYIEYDSSDKTLTENPIIAEKVKSFNENAVEKIGNDALAQYWILGDNERRQDYIDGKNETYPNPKHIDELIADLTEGYKIHKENDMFVKAVYEKGSTKRMISGHNHCDGYEVTFDGITYDSIVKTGDIYVDKDWDMGNHGGTFFTIKQNGDSIEITSKALYTRKTDYVSTRYPRPVEDF